VDITLSGDIITFFSGDLVEASVRRFEEAFRDENLSGISNELSPFYNDGSISSKSAKLREFEDFFTSDSMDVSSFSFSSDLEIVTLEDGQTVTVNTTYLLVRTTITTTTASVSLDRNAIPDDGFLDFTVIGDVKRREVIQCLPGLYKGTHIKHFKIFTYKTRRLEIETEDKVFLEIDGETAGYSPFTFEIIPRIFNVFCNS